MQEIFTRRDLMTRGLSRVDIEDAVRSGTLARIRRDRYCHPSTPPPVVTAVSAGGVLGCVSLLALLGVWVTRSAGVHIHRAPHGRSPATTATVHCVTAVAPGTLGRAGILDALLVAMHCLRMIDAVATVDSALHLGLVRMSDLAPYCADQRRAEILALVDARSESGLESIVRVALVLAGLRVQIQVRIRGVGRVDLLVEGCVIVETDGAAYHAGARRHVDHQRDAAGTSAGYSALRFDAVQVLTELADVVDAVMSAVAAHRAGRFSAKAAADLRRRAGGRLP